MARFGIPSSRPVGSDTMDFYFNDNWQLLETRSDSDPDPLDQYVWDTRYIDAPVVRFHDANLDGDYADAGDNTLYYTGDANFNATALVDGSTGSVVERYSYDAYGKATVYNASWTVQTGGTQYDNAIQYAGYHLDAETGLMKARHRDYHATLGNWVERDPITFGADDTNLYRYVFNTPQSSLDPSGLITVFFQGRVGQLFPASNKPDDKIKQDLATIFSYPEYQGDWNSAGRVHHFKEGDVDAAVKLITETVGPPRAHCQPIVLIGHSKGGDTALGSNAK